MQNAKKMFFGIIDYDKQFLDLLFLLKGGKRIIITSPQAPGLTSVHTCDDKNVGVSDLVGLIKKL